MNRQSRRHPGSPFLPALYPSKSSVISSNKKRNNTSVNTKVVKKRRG